MHTMMNKHKIEWHSTVSTLLKDRSINTSFISLMKDCQPRARGTLFSTDSWLHTSQVLFSDKVELKLNCSCSLAACAGRGWGRGH